MIFQTATPNLTSHQAAQTVAQPPVPQQHPVSSIPPFVQPVGWSILAIVILAAIVFYIRRIRKFAQDYAALSERMDSHFGSDTGTGLSPGYTYTVASRGPSHARDAEMQSADARWRQVSMAFPHLNDRAAQRPLILVSSKYTNLREVSDMQSWLGTKVSSHVVIRHRDVLRPAWIEELGEDFDALRHPQLAIANPAIYTFPFFLTWQRRHQWGVLPYAVHNRLGVICHPDHPNVDQLRKTELAYGEDIKRARDEQSALWVNDPKYASWLPLLLKAAGSTPIKINRASGAPPLTEQHTSGTVFSVGAYLHKEILPLMCTILPDARVGATYAENARELEISQLNEGLMPTELDRWPKTSAVIADLAVLSEKWKDAGWSVYRLPHCVYVPIGIGFSVAAVPLLLEHAAWRNDLLNDVGEALSPVARELADIGIELDNRLWTADREDWS